MPPEYVAEGFYKLVTMGDNGSVMWAIKDTPFLIIPDDAETLVFMRVVMAKILGKLTGNDLITVTQQKIFFAVFVIFMLFMYSWLF